MKSFARVVLCIGALPLLAYPFVLLASLLSFAQIANITEVGGRRLVALILAMTCQAGALLYPIVYAFSVIRALRSKTLDEASSLKTSAIPILYLFVLTILWAFWAVSDVVPKR